MQIIQGNTQNHTNKLKLYMQTYESHTHKHMNIVHTHLKNMRKKHLLIIQTHTQSLTNTFENLRHTYAQHTNKFQIIFTHQKINQKHI